MAGSNFGVGLSQRSLSLFPSRPSGGVIGLKTRSFSLKTYTADRFAIAEGIGGSGSYIYELPGGVDDNDLFIVEADTGVLSAPHPILDADLTKSIRVRITDQSDGTSVDVPATVDVVGTIHRWNVATLSTHPGGGLENWIAGTENSAQMDALRSRLLAEQTADQSCAFEITIPAGQYDHQRPQSFRGIRRYRLIGAGKSATSGTRLRNTSNSGSWYDAIHFLTNFDPYQRTGGTGGPGPEHYGFLIDTAIAGSIQVTLKQAVDPPRLSGVGIGRRVWIASGIASAYPGSYPPHNRYFEPAIITAYSGTGVGATITLDRPLRHTHDADAPEVSSIIAFGAFGRARIVFGDQDYSTSGGILYPESIWYPGTEVVVLEGIRFLPNPNWDVAAPQIASEQVQVFGAQYARLENVYMTSWGPQISERQVLRSVDVVGKSEPDAQIWEVLIEDSDIGHMGGPNGPANVMAQRTTFRDDIRLGMGKFICDDCDFTKWRNSGEHWTLFTMDHLGPTTEVKITNSRFWASGSGSKPVFGGSPRRDFAVGAEITYDAGPPSKITAAFPRQNPDNTAWSWLATNMSDSGIGRVSYLEGSTPRWGSIITIKCPSGPDGAVEVEIEWESGAGGGITNGTALRFYKLINLVLQDVTFDGWPNEESVDGTAHQAANHEIYTLAGQGVPTNVWGIVITP